MGFHLHDRTILSTQSTNRGLVMIQITIELSRWATLSLSYMPLSSKSTSDSWWGASLGQGLCRFSTSIPDDWPHSHPRSNHRGKTLVFENPLLFPQLMKGVWLSSRGGPILEALRHWHLRDTPHFYYASPWVCIGPPPHKTWFVGFYQGYHRGEAGMSSLTHFVRDMHRWARNLSTQAYPTWGWLPPLPCLDMHPTLKPRLMVFVIFDNWRLLDF